MKVALLKSHLKGKGGLEKYTIRLGQAFKEKGCETVLLTAAPVETSIPSIPLGNGGRLNVRALRAYDKKCREWIDKHRPNVVFGLDRHSYQTHYRAGNGCHAAYLDRRRKTEGWFKGLTFSFNPLHRTLLEWERQTYQDPDLKVLFTNSHMVKKEIQYYYQTPDEKITVVHNGVEWEEMEGPFQKRKTEKTFKLLFIGNEYRRKGLAPLLKALREVKAPYHLSVVGKERKPLLYQEMAKDMPVTFYGPQDDTLPFYQKADAVVIPSLYDPFANVTVEALAMGCFVLSSPSNGGSEVLTPETGAIIPDDIPSFTHLLEQTIGQTHNPLTIRNSIQYLDFSKQLAKIVDKTLETT